MRLPLKKAAAAALSSALLLLSPGPACYQALALTIDASAGGAPLRGLAMLGSVTHPGLVSALGPMAFGGIEVAPVLSSLSAAGLSSPQGTAVAAALETRLAGLGREPWG